MSRVFVDDWKRRNKWIRKLLKIEMKKHIKHTEIKPFKEKMENQQEFIKQTENETTHSEFEVPISSFDTDGNQSYAYNVHSVIACHN